jgi:hypothetical protein
MHQTEKKYLGTLETNKQTLLSHKNIFANADTQVDTAMRAVSTAAIR